MPEPPEHLSQGSIVWADVPDHRGITKRRPLVIITESDEIMLDRTIVRVAVTTTFPDPPPRRCVELPWHARRHPATQLARRSAAVCDWLVQLRPSQVVQIKGFVQTKTLLGIINRVRELNEPGDIPGSSTA